MQSAYACVRECVYRCCIGLRDIESFALQKVLVSHTGSWRIIPYQARIRTRVKRDHSLSIRVMSLHPPRV